MGLLWYYPEIYWQIPETLTATALRRSFIKAAEETLFLLSLKKRNVSSYYTVVFVCLVPDRKSVV